MKRLLRSRTEPRPGMRVHVQLNERRNRPIRVEVVQP
jgi:hypothetical protein